MKTAVDVHNYLVARDIPHELVGTQGRVQDPERWATVLGLEPEQVGRVMLFERADGEGLVAAAVPADREADPALVASAAGSEVASVSDARTTDLTEFFHEALPPVGLPDGTLVLLDDQLASQEVVFLPAGEATSLLKIRPEDLLRATGGAAARLAP